METIFNLKSIRSELNAQQWELDEFGEGEVRSVYLGTVMGLYPSGKYYTCWANNNVVQEEIDRDAEWQEKAEGELLSIGCYLMPGGDPCDIFAAECRDIEEE
jgi:hypothetical protein